MLPNGLAGAWLACGLVEPGYGCVHGLIEDQAVAVHGDDGQRSLAVHLEDREPLPENPQSGKNDQGGEDQHDEKAATCRALNHEVRFDLFIGHAALTRRSSR
jgi:hypothetical protein